MRVKTLLEDPFMNLSEGEQRLVLDLADLLTLHMGEEDMLRLCPDDYGASITEDHHTCVWARLVDYFSELDTSSLLEYHDLHFSQGYDVAATIEATVNAILYLDYIQLSEELP